MSLTQPIELAVAAPEMLDIEQPIDISEPIVPAELYKELDHKSRREIKKYAFNISGYFGLIGTACIFFATQSTANPLQKAAAALWFTSFIVRGAAGHEEYKKWSVPLCVALVTAGALCYADVGLNLHNAGQVTYGLLVAGSALSMLRRERPSKEICKKFPRLSKNLARRSFAKFLGMPLATGSAINLVGTLYNLANSVALHEDSRKITGLVFLLCANIMGLVASKKIIDHSRKSDPFIKGP